MTEVPPGDLRVAFWEADRRSARIGGSGTTRRSQSGEVFRTRLASFLALGHQTRCDCAVTSAVRGDVFEDP
jgi:hypothetical protein